LVSAQRVLHEQELLRQDLQSAADRPVGSLTLGAVASVLPIAARFAGLLQRRHPGLSVVLRSMSSPDIEAGLENLSVDIALGYTDRLKQQSARITTIDQYIERYFLLRRAENPGEHRLGLCASTHVLGSRFAIAAMPADA
jgi:DNA-binding transcriptional LysR family regulator